MPEAVAATYLHRDKLMTSRSVLALPERRLKWYCVAARDLPVPREIETTARAFLSKAKLEGVNEFGLVLLHRCGPDF
jgi:hypothetical protein